MRLSPTRTPFRSAQYHSHVCRSQSRLERGFDFSETYADESDPPALTVCDEYAPEVLELFEKASKRCPSVSLDPQVMEGQPCIAGTRIPVRAVLRAVEQYGSVEGALRCYPHLTVDLIKDALYFSQVVLDPSRGIDESATTP